MILLLLLISCAQKIIVHEHKPQDSLLLKQSDLTLTWKDLYSFQEDYLKKKIEAELQKERLLLHEIERLIISTEGGQEKFLNRFPAQTEEAPSKRQLAIQAYFNTLFRKNPVIFYKHPPLTLKKDLSFIKNQNKGSGSLKVTIFLDYSCGHCGNFIKTELPLLEKRFGSKITLQTQSAYFYEQLHPIELLHLCAKDKNRYFEFQEEVFKNQQQISNPKIFVEALAKKFNINENLCFKEKQQELKNLIAQTRALKVFTTPTIFIDDELYLGSIYDLGERIEDYLSKPRFIYQQNSEFLASYKDLKISKKDLKKFQYFFYAFDFDVYKSLRQELFKLVTQKYLEKKEKKTLDSYLASATFQVTEKEVREIMKQYSLPNEAYHQAENYVTSLKRNELYEEVKNEALGSSPLDLYLEKPITLQGDFKEDLVIFYDFNCPQCPFFFQEIYPKLKKKHKSISFKNLHRQELYLSKITTCFPETVLKFFQDPTLVKEKEDVLLKKLSLKDTQSCLTSPETEQRILQEKEEFKYIPHVPSLFIHNNFEMDLEKLLFNL